MDVKGQSRRSFLVRMSGLAGRAGLVGGVLGGFVALRRGGTARAGFRNGLGVLRPPGSVDEAGFQAKCIRCTRCADACEAQCIRFFGADAGISQGTPYIDPIHKPCTLCLQCGKACPTGAILPLEKKEEARMGLAVVDKRLCVSHAGTGVCGACFTVCPFRGKAITQGTRFAPEVHEEHCVGCGLCERHCIVDERPGLRAIMVEGRKEKVER